MAQIERVAKAGADIVRVSVPTMEAAEAFGEIRKRSPVPLVADIHFDYKIALRAAELGADCLRINPGNIGRDDRVRAGMVAISYAAGPALLAALEPDIRERVRFILRSGGILRPPPHAAVRHHRLVRRRRPLAAR